MQLFDQHLAELYKLREINGTEALRLATNPDAVALAMKGITTRDTARAFRADCDHPHDAQAGFALPVADS